MTPTTHIVKVGDTLWDLSQQYLQDPKRWPEIWNYNNDAFVRLPAANKMRPSMAIKNPHLIFVGQKLLVPGGRVKSGGNSVAGRTKAVNNVQSIPVQYSVDSREYTQILSGGFVAKVRISAEVTVQSDKTIPFINLKNNNLNITSNIKQNNSKLLNSLLSDFTVGLNVKTKQISFESKMTLNAGKSYEHTWSTKVTLDSVTGQPTYSVSIAFPEIKGKVENQVYLATKYQVDIDVVHEGSGRNNYSPAIPVTIPARNESSGWVYAQAGGLVVGAVVIVVGTIVEDILTAGLGISDDAVCFAFAAGLIGRAMLMVRTHQMSVTLTNSISGAAAAL